MCVSHIVCGMCTWRVFCSSTLCLCEFFLCMYCVWCVLACVVCFSVEHLCMCAMCLGLLCRRANFSLSSAYVTPLH